MNEESPISADELDRSLDRKIQQMRFKRALAYGVASILMATSGALAVRDQQLIEEKDATNAAYRSNTVPAVNRVAARASSFV